MQYVSFMLVDFLAIHSKTFAFSVKMILNSASTYLLNKERVGMGDRIWLDSCVSQAAQRIVDSAGQRCH